MCLHTSSWHTVRVFNYVVQRDRLWESKGREQHRKEERRSDHGGWLHLVVGSE